MAERELARRSCPTNIVVDCSHGNSNKDPSVQPLVAENCVAQIIDGNRSIVGLMLESHLKAGNQPIPKDLSTLEYGVSITDPCIDWAEHRGAAAQAPSVLARRAALSRAAQRIGAPSTARQAEEHRRDRRRRSAARGRPS